MTRRFVAIALVVVIASSALVVWWASAHDGALDGGEPVLASAESRAERTANVELDAESSASVALRGSGVEHAGVDESRQALAEIQPLTDERPVSVRVRLVDAEHRTITGLTGTLEIRDDVVRTKKQPSSVGHGDVNKPGSRDEYTLNGPPKIVEIPWNCEYLFEAPPDSSFKIELRAKGYRRISKSVSIPANTARIDVEFTPVGQRSIDVSLRTPDGGSFIAALRKLEWDGEKLLRPQLDEHEPDLRGSGFVPFQTTRHASLDDAYWRTFAADTHRSVTLKLYLNEVLIASERAPAGFAHLQVVVPMETVIDVISARQSITGFNEPK